MPAPARNNNTQNVQYLRKDFTYLDYGSTLEIGTLPAGAMIVKPLSGVQVNVVFNAATTNVLDIGTSADDDFYATDLALGVATFVPIDEAVTMAVASDTTIYGKPAQTGTAATTGSGTILIAFVLA